MNKYISRAGLVGGIAAVALSVGRGNNSRAQNDFSHFSIPVVKYVEPSTHSKDFDIYMLPTEKSTGSFGLSLAEEYGGRTTLISRDRFGDQVIRDPLVFEWLVGDIISSQQYTREKSNWGDILRPSLNGVAWDNFFKLKVTSNLVFGGGYVDKVSILSPNKKGVDYIFNKQTGVVTHIVKWKSDEQGNQLIDSAEDFNPASQYKRQNFLSNEKDNLLDELHLRG